MRDSRSDDRNTTYLRRQPHRTTTNSSRRRLEHFHTIEKMICSRHTHPSVIGVSLSSVSSSSLCNLPVCAITLLIRDKNILRECEKSSRKKANNVCQTAYVRSTNTIYQIFLIFFLRDWNLALILYAYAMRQTQRILKIFYWDIDRAIN